MSNQATPLMVYAKYRDNFTHAQDLKSLLAKFFRLSWTGANLSLSLKASTLSPLNEARSLNSSRQG